MSRNAKKSDYRRALSSGKNWPLTIKEFSWSDLPILGTGSIKPTVSMVNIAGVNGTGKSKLLAAFSAAISDDHASSAELNDFDRGTITVHVYMNNIDYIYVYDFGMKRRKVFFDPSYQCEEIKLSRIDIPEAILVSRNRFREIADRDLIINGIPEYELSEDDLIDVNSIANKNYSSVSRFITDDGMHFFIVEAEDATYDSLSMGLGELSALTIWSNLKEMDHHTILALEEPESFLSPSARSSLGEFLVKESVRKKHVVVTSSHSADIVLAAGVAGAFPVYRLNGCLRTCSDTELPELMELIGHSYRKDRIIYVEDELAKCFLTAMILSELPSLMRTLEIVHLNGFGDLVKLGKILFSGGGTIKPVLAFDYDKKGSDDIAGIPAGMKCFIPSINGVEIELIEVMNTHMSEVASIFPACPVRLHMMKSKGDDPHDVIIDFCQKCNILQIDLCMRLYELWRQRFWTPDIQLEFDLIRKVLYPAER